MMPAEASAARHRLRSTDLTKLVFVADPRLSPDGAHAVAVVTRVVEQSADAEAAEDAKPAGAAHDPPPPGYRSNLHLFALDGSEQRQLTFGAFADTAPRFAPDGSRLAYLSRRQRRSKAQLMLLRFDGGEPERLTDQPGGISSFAWQPDSRTLAYLAAPEPLPEAAKASSYTVDRLAYKRDGKGLLAPGAGELVLLEPSGRERRLPLPPCAPTELAFSADGRYLYLVAPPDDAAEADWLAQIYRLTLSNGRLRPLLPAPQTLSSLAVSPDGDTIAFLGPSRADDFASETGLWLVPASGGRPRLLVERPAAAPSIGGDSRYGSYPVAPAWDGGAGRSRRAQLIFLANEAGASYLAALTPTAKRPRVRRLDGDAAPRAITAFDAARGVTLFTAERPEAPGELFVRGPDGSERQLSNFNGELATRFAFRRADGPISCTADDGTELRYWRLEPAKPRRDRALVVQVHGGPHTNYGYGFYFEFQLLAAAGYTVVFGNPRGSSSFGSDFATAMLGAYGTIDADDVLAMARHARTHHARPRAPLHLTGGSYGGFMTNWLVAHTDAFSSAVTQRSICNWLSFYGSSDIGYRFAEREVGGTPWADCERLWRQSPLRYAANVTTPTLIVHAEEDLRCPLEQAEQWFVALKRLGKAPTRLLRIPGETHELSRSGRPDRRIARLDAILDWFARHPK